MFKSCKWCDWIHGEGFACPKKPIKKRKYKPKESTEVVRFRSSYKWNVQRELVKKRDNYLCQICFRELYFMVKKYNYCDVQVHHVVPISIDKNLRLDNPNLITLCPFHHRMCENGEIPRNIVTAIINEQEQKNLSIPPTIIERKF